MKLLALFKKKGGAGGWPDIYGKVVVIYSIAEQRGGVYRDARLVKVGFSHFVIGRRVELDASRQERWSKAIFWTAIHEVAQMMVFDDIESAKRAFDSEEAEGSPSPSIPVSGEVSTK